MRVQTNQGLSWNAFWQDFGDWVLLFFPIACALYAARVFRHRPKKRVE